MLSRQLRAHSTPAVIGITGAQGTGKSTLASLLVTELLAQGIGCAAVSLDDYYLTRQARQQLAGTVHPLLAQRGVPGTHDIGRALSDARQVLAGAAVALPRFDKALDDSLPDRPAAQLDLLIVEGWCLGLAAEAESGLVSPVNQLEATEDSSGAWRRYVNQQLAASYQPYFDLLQPLIWLKAPDWDSVCRWRAKQEQQLWQQRGTGMTTEQLARFMLPFQRLTQLSYQQLPARANYTIVLNQAQQPQFSG
ncbi:kinase [Alishewanella jeotgali]|uniref:Kinase-like protein n=1 Tax=Alishewanella jeotgali KCTC 22429 TaxID=1129374 RepID=H3ZE10_9ALTE|nr:kinase [Alishewanella jeotgali]EHR41187.1 kinase-like protein [Alishewanella jeotgali KCTC 22429]